MTALYLVLYLLGAVFFLLSAFSVIVQRVNLLAAGAFFWILVPLIMTFQKL